MIKGSRKTIYLLIMREIKFRAWWAEPKIMHEFELGQDYFKGCLGADGECYTCELEFADAIMQYTGLKDKNGKEIYEGDVLRGYGSAIKRFVVSFSNGSFVLYHNFGRWGLLSRIFEIEELPVEIIGNLYENPELLNQ